jgi:hypothetical protein
MVGVVLSLGLQRQQPTEVLLDLGTILAGLLQQY